MAPMVPPNVAAGVVAELANSIREGRYPWWYPDGAKRKAIDYFVYGSDFVPLTASLTVSQNLTISGDAAFVVLAGVLLETATDNVTVLTIPPLLINLRDSGSGRFLSNQAIAAQNWFGTAEQPKYWDIPKVFAPNTTLAIEVQNLEATNRNVRIAFHGFKIFNFQP